MRAILTQLSPASRLPVRIERSYPNLTICLSLLPSIDAIINQVNTIFQITVGPLSLLQVFRGVILGIVSIVLLSQSRRMRTRLPRLIPVTIFFLISLIIFAIKEYCSTGKVAMSSTVAYAQMAYWVVLWLPVAMICTSSANSRRMLWGLVAGCTIAAASIYIGYLVGYGNYYSRESIASSAGWFNTAKGVAGVLLVGAFSAVYLSQFSSKFGTTLAALFMFGASFLTYARAALVAAALALLWVLTWSVCFRVSAAGRRNTARFVILLIVFIVVVLSAVGTADLERRWSDVSDTDRAGSGRATFWRIALDSFAGSEWEDKIAGRGYEGMLDLMESGYGLRIHTHNDLLDLLLVGGVLGILALAAVSWVFIDCVMALPRSSLAFCLASGVLIVLLCQGLLTGQLFGPDVVLTYAIGVTAISGTMSKRSVRGNTYFERRIIQPQVQPSVA